MFLNFCAFVSQTFCFNKSFGLFTEMTTLAQDIEALMKLGRNLETATQLAREDRAISRKGKFS